MIPHKRGASENHSGNEQFVLFTVRPERTSRTTRTTKFGLLKLEADGVSRDPAVVQAYVNDPLVCTGKISARLAGELLGATQRITAEAEKITLPILILHGGADKLVESDASKTFYDRIRSTDKTLKIYPGLYHEVFNEPDLNNQ